MIEDPPILKGNEPMKSDGLVRSGDVIPNSQPHDSARQESIDPVAPANVRPLGGRRISFAAWGLAAVAGIAIWTLIFRLI